MKETFLPDFLEEQPEMVMQVAELSRHTISSLLTIFKSNDLGSSN